MMGAVNAICSHSSIEDSLGSGYLRVLSGLSITGHKHRNVLGDLALIKELQPMIEQSKLTESRFRVLLPRVVIFVAGKCLGLWLVLRFIIKVMPIIHLFSATRLLPEVFFFNVIICVCILVERRRCVKETFLKVFFF